MGDRPKTSPELDRALEFLMGREPPAPPNPTAPKAITDEPSIYTKRYISHEEAREVAGRLIASHFRKGDHENARISIPANPDRDDDLLIGAYIKQQAALAPFSQPTDERVREIVANEIYKALDEHVGSMPTPSICTTRGRGEIAAVATKAVGDYLRSLAQPKPECTGYQAGDMDVERAALAIQGVRFCVGQHEVTVNPLVAQVMARAAVASPCTNCGRPKGEHHG